MSARYLIVNADDFGASRGVNLGVARAHEHGILTSASLMVRGAAAAEAAAYARDHPDLSVGLHVDLGEWRFESGGWHAVYEVVPTGDEDAVAAEAERQLDAFRRLLGADPTHLDSHQHVHRDQPARAVLARIARRLNVPLRHFSPRVRYRGDFFGQTSEGEPFGLAIGVEALVAVVATLEPGVTELGSHPGLDADVDSVYRDERAVEVETLCDPRVREALAAGGVELCSFRHPAVSAAEA